MPPTDMWSFVQDAEWEVFVGLFADRWLNGYNAKRFGSADPLFFCESCGEDHVYSGEGDAAAEKRNGSGAGGGKSGASAPNSSTSGFFKRLGQKFTASTAGSTPNGKTKSSTSSKSAPSSGSAPGGAASGAARPADEDEPLPITPRNEGKEIFLCATCCRCFCKKHCVDHQYSYGGGGGGTTLSVPPSIIAKTAGRAETMGQTAPGGGISEERVIKITKYPQRHFFFLSVPYFISTHPEHTCLTSESGLQMPTVFIDEIEQQNSAEVEEFTRQQREQLRSPTLRGEKKHMPSGSGQHKTGSSNDLAGSKSAAGGGGANNDDAGSFVSSVNPLWRFYPDFFPRVADYTYEKAITLPANRTTGGNVSEWNRYYYHSPTSTQPQQGQHKQQQSQDGLKEESHLNKKLESMPQFYFAPCLKHNKATISATSTGNSGGGSSQKKSSSSADKAPSASTAAGTAIQSYSDTTWAFRFFNAANNTSKLVSSANYTYQPSPTLATAAAGGASAGEGSDGKSSPPPPPPPPSPESVLRQLGQLLTVLVYLRRRSVRLEFPTTYCIYSDLLLEDSRHHAQPLSSTEVGRVGKSTEITETHFGGRYSPTQTSLGGPLAPARPQYSRREAEALMAQAAIDGFENPSVYCYFNSVVQCLLRCKFFTRPLMTLSVPSQSPGPVTTALVQLGQQVRTQSRESARSHASTAMVRKLHRAICKVSKEAEMIFGTEEQQDAQELLLCLLNGIAEEFDRFWKEHHASPAMVASKKANDNKEISNKSGAKADDDANKADKDPQRLSFEGSLVMRRVCLTCGFVATRTETFMALSVPIANTLQEGLDSVFKPIELKGKERYACESCFKRLSAQEQEKNNNTAREQQKEKEAMRKAGERYPTEKEVNAKCVGAIYRIAQESTQIASLGGTLAVHLLRFRYDPNERDFIKVTRFVEIATTLDLGGYLTNEEVARYTAARNCEKLAARFPSVKDPKIIEEHYTRAAQNAQLAAQLLQESGYERCDTLGSRKPSMLLHQNGGVGNGNAIHSRTSSAAFSGHERVLSGSLNFSPSTAAVDGVVSVIPPLPRAATTVPGATDTPLAGANSSATSALDATGNNSSGSGGGVGGGGGSKSGGVVYSFAASGERSARNNGSDATAAATSPSKPPRGNHSPLTTPPTHSLGVAGASNGASPFQSGSAYNNNNNTSSNNINNNSGTVRPAFDPYGLHAPKLPSTKRRLVGIVAHRGSLHGGHYIAYVRDTCSPDIWFRCDDEDVTIVSEAEVLRAGAEVYLAFYE